MPLRVLAILGVVAVCALAPVRAGAAPEPAPRAVNLVATPAVKRALRAAFLRLHSSARPSSVRGPLKGSVYYARYGRFYWALATFSLPVVGTTDQPEVFRRVAGGRWVDKGDTGGNLCAVPRPVVAVWRLLARRTGC